MAKKSSQRANKPQSQPKSKIETKSSAQAVANPLFSTIPQLIPKIKFSGLSAKTNRGFIFVFGRENKAKVQSLINQFAPTWQKAQVKKSNREVYQFVGNRGPVWILAPKEKKGPVSHGGRLEESTYSWMRDQAGSIFGSFKAYGLENVQVEFHSVDEKQQMGFLVGLELAAYSYKNMLEGESFKEIPKIVFKKEPGNGPSLLAKKALALGSSVNLARHLVNTPPNFLNPQTLCEFVELNFAKAKGMQVEIWDESRLKKEGAGLLLGVGQGASCPPALVHLRYRPQNKTATHAKRPLALVGKGITFDSGGLDLKPSSAMRLMKKDMGGAAAVLALAHWAVESEYPRALDFYLALAENSVDSKSMRPSDVLVARNGMKIEIHNTDAEGRLVLADALDVAVTQTGSDEPELVINLATLTGAIKVALGADLAGLFSNHDPLAEELNLCGQRMGDLNWRMPLFGKMTSGMTTPFADLVNAVDGFGGAITAALFLEKFVKQKPFAHLDIYSWNDKAQGALSFSGGSGQPVQALVEFLNQKI